MKDDAIINLSPSGKSLYICIPFVTWVEALSHRVPSHMKYSGMQGFVTTSINIPEN